MFLVNNIINSVTKKDIDTALVVCAGRQNYAIDLCKVFKKVFFYTPFNDPGLPKNGYVIMNTNVGVLQTSFDVVISIGEGQSATIADEISNKLHIPSVKIRTVTDMVCLRRPFSVPEPNVPKSNNGLEISMYSSVESKSGICIPDIRDETLNIEKEYDNIYLAQAPENIISRYTGLLNQFPIKIAQGINPSHGIIIDTWLGNSSHLLNSLRTGAVVICPRTLESEMLIKEGVNGFLYKDFKELLRLVEYIYKNKSSLSSVSESAKQLYLENTITRKEFETRWGEIIQTLSQRSEEDLRKYYKHEAKRYSNIT